MATIKCVCPLTPAGETRHPDGDVIELRDHLDFRGAVACRNAVSLLRNDDPDAGTGDILAVLTEGYLLNGIESWTLLNAKGKPIEPTRTAIRAFMADHLDEALELANEADSLYMESVMLPLIVRGSTSSATTPTASSTSAKSGSPVAPRKRSKPSSTSTSPTDGTETTSDLPDGDSSSSPRLKSVS